MTHARATIGVAAAAFALLTVLVVPASELTAYAGRSWLMATADVVAGLSLLAAGLVTRGRVGLVALLASVAWFAPDWVGWEEAAPLVRSMATAAALLATPLLLHVALGSAPRALYAAAAVGAVGLALVHDPFLDPNCWANCTDNALLLHGDQSIARVLGTGVLIAFLAGGIVVAVRVARRPTAALVAATQAAYAGALLIEPGERPDDAVFAALFMLRAAAVTLLAIALVRTAYGAWRTRAAVARLAAELGEAPPPGTLRAALATSLGDPGLEVVYPAGGRCIDDEGRVVHEPVAGGDRAVTRIVRGDRCVAIVVHARAAVAQDDLARDIGAAARLAVENERLQAELLHQLDDLRASRARIVETGDAARRLLERNLHDGAQQRLLALVYDMRLARSTAGAEGEDRVVAALDDALRGGEDALEELRELAHGIHPAILTEAGLGPALWGLVNQAAIPVQLADPGPERYAAAVETAAYVVAGDAILDASRRTATYARMNVQRLGTRLVLEVDDDGKPDAAVPLTLVDRVGAVGGRVERAGHVLRAELPCA
jgi:signal transduction histidine kinase